MPSSKTANYAVWLILILGTSPAQGGAPVDIRAIGDGGSTQVEVENRSVYSVPIQLGARGRGGVSVQADRYARTRFVVQCTEGMNGETPALSLNTDGRTQSLNVDSPDLSDGVPAFLVTDARTGRAQLEGIIKHSRADMRLRHMSPAHLPSYFGAIRSAPFVVMELHTLQALAIRQRQALRNAVASGMLLIVAVGDGVTSKKALADFGSFELGESQTPDSAVADKLTRVATQREIRITDGVQPLVSSSRGVIVAQGALGLGAVRILATPLRDLEIGPIASALFSEINTGHEQTVAWLRRGGPSDDSAGSLLGSRVWLSLVALPLCFLLSGGRRKVSLVVAAGWTLFALGVSAGTENSLVQTENALAFPYGESSIRFVSQELIIKERGQTVLPLPHGQFALENAYPNGACLVRNEDAGVWVIPGEPGDRVRLTYIAVSGVVEAEKTQLGVMSEWPRGPLSGHPVFTAKQAQLPLDAVQNDSGSQGVMEGRFTSVFRPVVIGGAPVPGPRP